MFLERNKIFLIIFGIQSIVFSDHLSSFKKKIEKKSTSVHYII